MIKRMSDVAATRTPVPGAIPERPGRPLAQHVETDYRATPLELFFDLVFVFAFTQVTGLMSENPTWEGLGQGMLVLALVWWAWGGYAWMTNALHRDDWLARLGLFSAMGAMLIAALAVPQAFGDDAVVFGLAYFAGPGDPHRGLRLRGRGGRRQRRDPQARPGLLVAPALIVVAASSTAGHRSRSGSSPCSSTTARRVRDVSGFRVSASHFAERFGLIIIIALGESIVAIGAGLEGDALTGPVIVAALAGSRSRSPSGGPTSTS